MIPYGYRAYTGKVFTPTQVDQYNRVQARINQYAGRIVPEHLLNSSHKLFSMFAARAA